MKIVFGIILLLFFCSLTNFVLWNVLGCKSSNVQTVKLGEYSEKLRGNKLKVIDEFDKLDNSSKIIEVDNVGKYYADIVLASSKAQCRLGTITNIYDGKVILENGKYVYQFKYDLIYPFSSNDSIELVDSSDKGATFQDFFFFKRVTGKSMYLELIQQAGYWELGSSGKYYSKI